MEQLLASKTSYNVGVQVFFNHPTESWIIGQISGMGSKTILVLANVGGDTLEFSAKESDLHPIVDESVLQITDDLLKLSELHEATLLNNIRTRFAQDQIYTYVGPIVVAVNPFKKLPIYTDEMIRHYRENLQASQASDQPTGLAPHIYSIADSSYNSMMETGKNQSVLISGESGAGKTETTKYVMNYLAHISRSKASLEFSDPGKIQNQIMKANPILEAFGNAKTLRNNNSSRFGKFIRIQFDKKGFLNGAEITNYLLEKSRVVSQAAGERSYHIFYQFLAGATPDQKEKYSLLDIDSYHYLNQSNCTQIEDVDDAEDFREVNQAFDVVGVSAEDKEAIFRVMSGILHLGNTQFVLDKTKTMATARIANADVLEQASSLLHVDSTRLGNALITRRNCIKGEWFTVPLDLHNATDSRDALAKALYASLFNWLVARINQTICTEDNSTVFIGLLDIFGFEHFQVNSFEQFSINFCNEKLQQHYNRHTFKWEQEACQAEEIDYTKIDFTDNQLCLDLIEKKPLGILSLLDEESNFPKATDASFLVKLFNNYPSHAHFEKPRLSRTTFIVKHYAGDVAYDTTGFLEKNKDTLQDDLIDLMQSSSLPFVKSLLEKPDKKNKGKKPTVGGEFKLQLEMLMTIINSTEPHWIRCIKPNTQKQANLFEGQSVIQQLRCAGVLETIRIRRAGYPIRILVDEFYKRFKLLHERENSMKEYRNVRAACTQLIADLNFNAKDCQLGLTKVFLRADQFKVLEELREKKLNVPAVTIQRIVRGWLTRLYYKKTRAAVRIQTVGRGWLRRRAYHAKKSAALVLQNEMRCYYIRVEFQEHMNHLREIQEAERIERERIEAEERELIRQELGQAVPIDASMLQEAISRRASRRITTSSISFKHPAAQPAELNFTLVLALLSGMFGGENDGHQVSLDALTQMEKAVEGAIMRLRKTKMDLINGNIPVEA
eukprot:TRINITY_DN5376_c0_g1_i1.p1 TRINITY_DN5376_c0_g1~~TRINITY_DN5376_c0_g1_i1.p1  ORF type:complete len:951 (-),score=287.82 TRINITY_DN5376_c0_g1_i1:42-2894(-)